MAGLGYKDFTAGAVLTAAQVDGYLMEQAVMNFAGTAARGSALSSVQAAGMMAHVGGGTVTVYDGSAWRQMYPSSAMTLITSGTLSGASVVLSSIPATYKDLKLIVRNYLPASDGQAMAVRVNNDSNANRYAYPGTNGGNGNAFGATFWNPFGGADNATSQGLLQLEIFDYANTTTWKAARAWGLETNATTTTQFNYVSAYFCAYNQTAAITSLTLLPTSGNFTSGDYLLYGIG